MAARNSLGIENEGVQELKNPFHHSIFYHHQCQQNEPEHYDIGGEMTEDVSMEVQRISPLLLQKSLTRRSFKKLNIKKWLKKKVLRTGSHTEANVPMVEVNVPIKKKEETDNIEVEMMEQMLHGENEVVETEEEIIKSINSNYKESLFNEEIDSAEDEIKCYTVHFGMDNSQQDDEMYPTEIIMVQHPKDDLREEVKDETVPQNEDTWPSDTEFFFQDNFLSSDHGRKEVNKEREEEPIKYSFSHKKNDPVVTEVGKEADKQQERDISEVFDEQKNGVSSFDHANTAEEGSTSAEQNGTDDQHKQRLAVFALLSLLLVYFYISTCL